MTKTAVHAEPERSARVRKYSPIIVLGLTIGIVLPVISALLYPTYRHFVQPAWFEWSRLLELPFVFFEIIIIHWALRHGIDFTDLWHRLTRDVKAASIVLLIGVFASSLLLSAIPLQSINISIITFVHFLFALSVFHLVHNSSSRDVTLFLALLGVGLIVLAMLTFFKFGFPPMASQVPGGLIEWASALPGFISVRHFGSWTGAVAAAFMAMLLYADDNERPSWPHFFYFLAAMMTVWSGTRAAILAIVLTTVILVLTRRKAPPMKAMGVLSILTGAAATAAWLLLPTSDAAFQLYDGRQMGSASQMASGRLELWAATWDRWLDSPMFGWGSGSVFWEVYVGWTHTQPHNAILQFLISWGLVGTAGAIWLLGRAIVAVQITASRQKQLQPLLAILYTLLLMSLFEGMLHYPRFITLIMIVFAVILGSNARHNSRPVLHGTAKAAEAF